MDESYDNIDALTFDFYGTLAYHRDGRGRGAMLMEYLAARNLKSIAWEHQVLYDVFERHGRSYSPGCSAEDKRNYVLEFTDRVFRRMGVDVSADGVASHADAVWEILGPASLAVFDDALQALQRLHEMGYPMAVVSNWQCGLGHFVEELGLAQAFQHVLASAEVGSQKPDRGIFDEASKQLGVAPKRILHVGDTYVDDVQGATGAGFNVVLVMRDDLALPPHVVSVASLAEVPALLQSFEN